MATKKPTPYGERKKAEKQVGVMRKVLGYVSPIAGPKPVAKKKTVPMPSKINPGKMTPEDKARLKSYQKMYPDAYPTKKKKPTK